MQQQKPLSTFEKWFSMSREAQEARRNAVLTCMGQPIPQPKPPAGAITADEIAAGQVVREYKSVGDMQQGIAKMAAQGWRVQSQTSYQPRQGAGRIIALGFVGAALFKPKAHFIVTYTR